MLGASRAKIKTTLVWVYGRWTLEGCPSVPHKDVFMFGSNKPEQIPLNIFSLRSTVREVCYLAVNDIFFDNEYVGVGVPSKQFRQWCVEQARLSGEGKAVVIRERFSHNGEKGGWHDTDYCQYSEDERDWGCSHLLAR